MFRLSTASLGGKSPDRSMPLTLDLLPAFAASPVLLVAETSARSAGTGGLAVSLNRRM